MTLYDGADAAFATAALPAGTQLLCMYVGGPGPGAPDARHIWTAGEANSYYRTDPELRFLPIAVHSYDNGDPVASANNGADAMERLGWAPFMHGLARRVCLIDCETLIDPPFFTAMQDQVYDRGFAPVLYGSAGFVTRNPCPRGYWLAAPTGRRPTSLNGEVRGIQYAWGPSWDLSVFDDLIWAAAGQGPRKEG